CRWSSHSFVSSTDFILLSLLLFLHAYDDPRDLHSFPTRRSSDLAPWCERPTRRSSPNPTRHPRRPTRQPGYSTSTASRTAATCPDRKSTRLNSSHVKISYAVFCLKKKTKKDDDRKNLTLTFIQLL